MHIPPNITIPVGRYSKARHLAASFDGASEHANFSNGYTLTSTLTDLVANRLCCMWNELRFPRLQQMSRLNFTISRSDSASCFKPFVAVQCNMLLSPISDVVKMPHERLLFLPMDQYVDEEWLAPNHT